MKLSDYVADFLIRKGLRDIFVLPGGGCMHLIDSVGQRKELSYVACLHEQTCAFAAEAYGEFDDRFGCALVTAGPGGTNALTGAACAWIEGAACLFISGQAKRVDLMSSQPLKVRSMGQQEVDIVAMATPVTKFAAIVTDPSRIRYLLEKALWTATNGRRGPVWIDVPLDVQAAQIEPESLEGFVPPAAEEPALAAPLELALAALKKARRPVIYVGNGVRTGGASVLFRQIADRANIPVLVTWKASDLLPEGHPQFVGRPGAIGQRAANFCQQKADWILVIGARLDLPSVAFNHANIAPKAFKVVVDIDPAEMAKFKMPIDVAYCGGAKTFLEGLVGRLGEIPSEAFTPWNDLCRSWNQRFPVVLPEHKGRPAGQVSTYLVIDELSRQLAASDVIVPGSSGPCSDIFYQAFRVKEGQRILNAPGLGAMGTGLPGTIGASRAAPGRRIVNINGEGGFQLNIQDLETVRRLQLPIKYFVLDNGGYRSIVAMQRGHFKGRLVASEKTSALTMPDTARIAAAYGIHSMTVESDEHLSAAIAESLASPGPVVCVIKTSVDELTIPRVTSEVRPDGTIVSKPMEDMFPFLDRAEFDAIMAS